MENNRTFQIPEGTVLANVCDYPVLATTRKLIDQDTTAACILNETGEFIWHCVEEGKSELQVVEEMTREYEATEEEIRSSVAAFLDSMVQQGLIILSDVE